VSYLPSKTILITGCSSGIGRCVAQTLHAQGWQVFATVRKEADAIALEMQGLQVIQMDMEDSASIHAGVQSVLEKTGGHLGALYNNAGFGQPGAIEDISREALRRQFETNVFGLQELTHLVVPVMRRQGYGRIIHMGSVLGLVTMGYRGAYCASKYAVEALADALRLELHNSNIFVSVIEAGPIESQFRQSAHVAYTQHVQTEQSAHKIDYQHLLRNMERLKANSVFTLPPDAVAKKVQHALESRRPRSRYYVTVPAYVFALLKRILPSCALDWIMRKIMQGETKP
jgi:NAD(P)-dependent dehydrogenase (short-subunit alcohol dehydrogenase family)